jgi:hypothetical protein
MHKSALAVFAAFVVSVLFPSVGFSEDRIDRIESELEELKKENIDLKNRLKIIEAYKEEDELTAAELVKISGYADAEYHITDEEGENDNFRIRHLSLIFEKKFEKEWKLFSEVEFEDAPLIESTHTDNQAATVQGKLFVEQVYIEYLHGMDMDLRFGRFLTPAGIWSIYHYYPYVTTQTRPLLVRNIFPHVSDGIQLRKSLRLLGSTLGTSLYVANGSGNPGRTDRNENKGVGLRLNYSLDFLSDFQFGASYFGETDNDDVKTDSYGLHTKMSYLRTELQAEYAIRENDPSDADSYHTSSSYVQLAYDITNWTLAGRYDWYEENSSYGDYQYRYTGALNYHFAHNVVGKAEYNRNEFDSTETKDYNEIILSIVVAIGDL